jgi:hypothetical protein
MISAESQLDRCIAIPASRVVSWSSGLIVGAERLQPYALVSKVSSQRVQDLAVLRRPNEGIAEEARQYRYAQVIALAGTETRPCTSIAWLAPPEPKVISVPPW